MGGTETVVPTVRVVWTGRSARWGGLLRNCSLIFVEKLAEGRNRCSVSVERGGPVDFNFLSPPKLMWNVMVRVLGGDEAARLCPQGGFNALVNERLPILVSILPQKEPFFPLEDAASWRKEVALTGDQAGTLVLVSRPPEL
jgi:hypothetical protein